MNDSRLIVLLLIGVIALAGVPAGCASDSPPSSPDVASPQETVPPAGAAEPETTPTQQPAGQETTPPASASEEESTPPVSPAEPVTGPLTGPYAPRTGDGVDVLYFETSNPCSCMAAVGDAVEGAVLTGFQDELQGGELRFFMAVSNAPANLTLVRELNSQPFDLFVIEYRDGESAAESVPEIWTLTGDDEGIVELVQTRVRAALERQR